MDRRNFRSPKPRSAGGGVIRSSRNRGLRSLGASPHPYRSPRPASPYGAGSPYLSPRASSPYLSPRPSPPYLSPRPSSPYLSPRPSEPYLSPRTSEPYLSPRPSEHHPSPRHSPHGVRRQGSQSPAESQPGAEAETRAAASTSAGPSVPRRAGRSRSASPRYSCHFSSNGWSPGPKPRPFQSPLSDGYQGSPRPSAPYSTPRSRGEGESDPESYYNPSIVDNPWSGLEPVSAAEMDKKVDKEKTRNTARRGRYYD